MNFHSDKWVMENIQSHYSDSLTHFSENNVVGIFCQGSTNYGLDVSGSDIDTKLIVTPSFYDVAFNKKPVSTTHVRENDEHIDFKDIRLMFQTFRKQNLNFIEILFTKYFIVNPAYKNEWDRLVKDNERIARYNPYGAVKTMKGIAMEKYHAMEHPYPSKVEILAKWGYDGKQVSHLVRVHHFLERYIAGEPYSECLCPQAAVKSLILDLKLQKIPLLEGREIAQEYLGEVLRLTEKFCLDNDPDFRDPYVEELLDSVQYNIMSSSCRKELI